MDQLRDKVWHRAKKKQTVSEGQDYQRLYIQSVLQASCDLVKSTDRVHHEANNNEYRHLRQKISDLEPYQMLVGPIEPSIENGHHHDVDQHGVVNDRNEEVVTFQVLLQRDVLQLAGEDPILRSEQPWIEVLHHQQKRQEEGICVVVPITFCLASQV